LKIKFSFGKNFMLMTGQPVYKYYIKFKRTGSFITRKSLIISIHLSCYLTYIQIWYGTKNKYKNRRIYGKEKSLY
jgi:hypothetical protein